MVIKINNIFVYGSLRPDFTSSISNIVHNNPKFKFNYYKALLPYTKMYYQRSTGYAIAIHNLKLYSKEDHIIGYILQTENIDEALKVFDEIEECPQVYERYVTQCLNTENNKEENAYFYSVKENFDKSSLIQLNLNDFKNFDKKNYLL